MKVAKNMDSVFANCTENELDFDVLFDNDDTIIDFIAGVDEAGNLLTGPNFDFTKLMEEVDMLEELDDFEARHGKVASHFKPEASVHKRLEVGGEVGDGKEVSGKENSAESNAHEAKDLKSETAKNKAVEKAMEISAQKFADQCSTPNCCKENHEYEGYMELVEAVIDAFMTKEEIMSEDASRIATETADYMIECVDADARAGKIDTENKGNKEGVKASIIYKQHKGKANLDPIADRCDAGSRAGKVDHFKDVEGVATRVLGAALEASGNMEKDLEDATEDYGIEKMDRSIVPDSVRMNGDCNCIDIKQESVQSNYRTLMTGMSTRLQNLALAGILNKSVLESAAAIYEASNGEVERFNEYVEYQEVLEAVIDVIYEADDYVTENAVGVALEMTEFVISESSALLETKADIVLKAGKDGKYRQTLGNKAVQFGSGVAEKIADGPAKKVADIVKNNPKRAAAIAAAAAGVAGGAYIAKKARDRKKANSDREARRAEDANRQDEYDDVLEYVISNFSKEELMMENAAEIAHKITNMIMENADELLPPNEDDEDIEAIASNNDPKIDLNYDYDDDELIDMVVDDDQL